MKTRSYTSPDGTTWTVEIMLPGATNAMIVFEHPDGATSRRDRYNWVNIAGPGARNVTSRAEAAAVMGELTDAQIALLFRRSMRISSAPVSVEAG
jgi:hypothetical protein